MFSTEHSVFADASIHGLQQLGKGNRKRSVLKVIFWLTIVLLAFGTIGYQLYSLYIFIMTYPSSVELSIKVEKSVFPAITACNRGVYKKSVMGNVPTVRNMAALMNPGAKARKKRSYDEAVPDSTTVNNSTPIEAAINVTNAHTRSKRQTISSCSNSARYENPVNALAVVLSPDFATAKSNCESYGGKLPSFMNMSEFNALMDIKNYYYGYINRWVWLGYQSVNGVWQDANGITLPSGFPVKSAGSAVPNGYASSGGNGNCSVAWSTSTWSDFFCTTPQTTYIAAVEMCMCPVQCPVITLPVAVLTDPAPINYNLGATHVTYTNCDPGKRSTGNGTIHCGINLATDWNNLNRTFEYLYWSWSFPSCTPQYCNALNLALGNGVTKNSTATILNSVVKFACPTGKYVVGPDTTTCSPIGPGYPVNWTDPVPTCVTLACPVVNISDSYGLSFTTSGSVLTLTLYFHCIATYTLVGAQNITCVDNAISANWSAPIPSCVNPIAALPLPVYSTAELLNMTTVPGETRPDPMAIAARLNDLMEMMMANLPPETQALFGFNRSDFMNSFSYNQATNEESLVGGFPVQELSNCYTFNHRNMTNPLMSKELGEDYGVSFIFDIQSDEYISTMTSPGIQLFIQEQLDPLLFGSMGQVLSPGFVYHLRLSKRIEIRVNVPPRPCITDISEVPYYFYPNYKYIPEACFRSYSQLQLIKQCGCGSPKFPLPIDKSAKFCEATKANCVRDILETQGENITREAQQYCPPACNTVTFDVLTTISRPNLESGTLKGLNKSVDEYNKNIVYVKVYFATDDVLVYTENLKYGITQILSDIGGSVGCIAGMSLVSIIEILAIMIKAIHLLCRRNPN